MTVPDYLLIEVKNIQPVKTVTTQQHNLPWWINNYGIKNSGVDDNRM